MSTHPWTLWVGASVRTSWLHQLVVCLCQLVVRPSVVVRVSAVRPSICSRYWIIMQNHQDLFNTQDRYGVPSSRLPSDEAIRHQPGDNVVARERFRSSPGYNPANRAHHAQNLYGPNNMLNYNEHQQSLTSPSAQLYSYHPTIAPQPSFSAALASQHHHHDPHHGGGFGTYTQFDNRSLGSQPPTHPYGGHGPAYYQQMPLQNSYVPRQQAPTYHPGYGPGAPENSYVPRQQAPMYHPGYGPGAPQPAPETRRPRLYPNAVPIMPAPALPTVPVAPVTTYDPAHHANLPTAPATPLERQDVDLLPTVKEEGDNFDTYGWDATPAAQPAGTCTSTYMLHIPCRTLHS